MLPVCGLTATASGLSPTPMVLVTVPVRPLITETVSRGNAGELRAAACCQAVRMGSRDLADMSNGGPVGRVPTKTTCRRRTSVARSVCHQFRCHVGYQDD